MANANGRREVYLTAGGYTRREIEEHRAAFKRDVDTTRRMIERNPKWAGVDVAEWYAGLAATLASFAVFDMGLPPDQRDHGSRYHAAMAQDAARAAMFALKSGYKVNKVSGQ